MLGFGDLRFKTEENEPNLKEQNETRAHDH